MKKALTSYLTARHRGHRVNFSYDPVARGRLDHKLCLSLSDTLGAMDRELDS
jgi:hypothetical protein